MVPHAHTVVGVPEDVRNFLRYSSEDGTLVAASDPAYLPDGRITLRVVLAERPVAAPELPARRSYLAPILVGTAAVGATILVTGLAMGVVALASWAAAHLVLLAVVVVALLLLLGGGSSCAGHHCGGCQG